MDSVKLEVIINDPGTIGRIFQALAKLDAGKVTVTAVHEVVGEGGAGGAAGATAPKPRGRPPGATTKAKDNIQTGADDRQPPADEPTTAEPEPAADATPEPATRDDVREALREFADQWGMEAASKKLAELGFQKVSGIPDEKFADVIKALKLG